MPGMLLPQHGEATVPRGFSQHSLKSSTRGFPGWFVEPFDMKAAGVWVLEPKALDKFIEREPERYSREDVKAMASALSSYVRSKANL